MNLFKKLFGLILSGGDKVTLPANKGSSGQVLGYTDNAGTLGNVTISGGATNLSITNITTTALDVASSTGAAATIPAATSSAAGLLVAADFGKIARVRSVILDMVYTTLPTLTSTHTTDGYTCTAGDIVGVAVQAGSVSNGIWTVNAGAWTRPTWADTDALLRPLNMVCKPNGSNLSGAEFQITNTSAITVGSTSIMVSQPVGSGVAVAGETSFNRYGSAAAVSLAMYANGGATAGFSITRGSGANGNATIANAGSGAIYITSGGVTVAALSSAASLMPNMSGTNTLQIGSSTTTGGILIGSAGSSNNTTARLSLYGSTSAESRAATPGQRVTSGTSQTISSAANLDILFDPSGAAIASYTITLPASTALINGQELLIHAGQYGVTTLTITAGSGTSIRGAITTLAGDAFARWKYNTATTKWMRIG